MKPSDVPVIEKLADALNRHGVLWVLVGGMAVTLYGGSYLTSDCDVAFEKTEANLKNLKVALEVSGPVPYAHPKTGHSISTFRFCSPPLCI